MDEIKMLEDQHDKTIVLVFMELTLKAFVRAEPTVRQMGPYKEAIEAYCNEKYLLPFAWEWERNPDLTAPLEVKVRLMCKAHRFVLPEGGRKPINGIVG